MPNPVSENTRSIGSLAIPFSSFSLDNSFCIFAISSLSASMPSPVAEETLTTGAFSTMVPFNSSFISSSTISSHSASTRSHLLITKITFSMPKSSNISKCSLVCGIMPSSAATTSKTKSIPTTPATMLLINFSCPGTSIIPHRVPSFISNQVKPSSIVIPRSFSSFRRSVFLPVNARIKVVFPWSMCPAVPIMMFFIRLPMPPSAF